MSSHILIIKNMFQQRDIKSEGATETQQRSLQDTTVSIQYRDAGYDS